MAHPSTARTAIPILSDWRPADSAPRASTVATWLDSARANRATVHLAASQFPGADAIDEARTWALANRIDFALAPVEVNGQRTEIAHVGPEGRRLAIITGHTRPVLGWDSADAVACYVCDADAETSAKLDGVMRRMCDSCGTSVRKGNALDAREVARTEER